jgi:hypothetical protein
LIALDAEMVHDACIAADNQALAVRRFQATTDPADMRAVEVASRIQGSAVDVLPRHWPA